MFASDLESRENSSRVIGSGPSIVSSSRKSIAGSSTVGGWLGGSGSLVDIAGFSLSFGCLAAGPPVSRLP